MATIRLAAPADAPAIHAIYAPLVRDTPISFELSPPAIEEIARRIESVGAQYPWLLCEGGNGFIAGYAYASRHRERAAYQWDVDVTVYVHPQARQRGVAYGLYTSLFELLRLQGFFNAYAAIALPNDASVRAHARAGFQTIGVHRQTGFKLGRWHDVLWMQLALQPHQNDPAPPRALPDILNHPDCESALRRGQSLIRL